MYKNILKSFMLIAILINSATNVSAQNTAHKKKLDKITKQLFVKMGINDTEEQIIVKLMSDASLRDLLLLASYEKNAKLTCLQYVNMAEKCYHIKVHNTTELCEWYTNEMKKVENLKKSEDEKIRRKKEETERRRIEQEKAAERRRIEAEQRRIEQERLAEIKRREEHVNAFLAQRETDVYEFSDVVKQRNKAKIEEVIKRTLDGSGINFNLPKFNITDDILVDYNGNTRHGIVINGLNNPEISKRLTAAIETLQFVPEQVAEPYTKEKYTVNTHGNFQFDASVDFYEKVKVKKRFQETIIKKEELENIKLPAKIIPYEGNYTLNVTKLTVNNRPSFDNSTVLNYRDPGGASNAFLSLLVPGLGDRRVTYDRKSGLAKGIVTYSLIGAGIGCKLYSNSEYKKYHAATEQSEMDRYYKTANTSNQVFYACVAVGATVWVWDIIWVWHKGAQNSKAHKAYKPPHLGFYYQPDLHATGLTYTINF